jgi:hypothetical protein
MSTGKSLQEIVEAERLDPNGAEMREIQRCRMEVETLLRAEFGTQGLSIRYGGSKSKGTMLKRSYDLDILSYVHHDNDRLGSRLSEIHDSVKSALEKQYWVDDSGTTALRLHAKDDRTKGPGLRIDVVPGRFIDASQTYVFLHQTDGEKSRLQTNPDKHIEFVRDSGVLDGVCALKLWRVGNGLLVRQFPFEILSVNLLKPKRNLEINAQVAHVLGTIASMTSPPRVEDPANANNDLSRLLTQNVWADLQAAAQRAVKQLPNSSWASILLVDDVDASSEHIAAVAASVKTVSRPWSSED